LLRKKRKKKEGIDTYKLIEAYNNSLKKTREDSPKSNRVVKLYVSVELLLLFT
jgi:hypothetical protein